MASEAETGQKRPRSDEDAESTGISEEPASPVEDEFEEEDSDSDVEFILGPAAQSRPNAQPIQQAPAAPQTSAPAALVPDDETARASDGREAKEDAPETASAAPPAKGTLDIDVVGQFNGQPVTSLVPQYLEEKPWRRPGADTSDYFNYGFDEFTWTAYCSRQDKLRANFTPQQMMQSMGMPMMPFGMPGMPGMPPMMFPQQRP